MKLTLIARYFNLNNAGVGRVASEIKKRLEDYNIDIETIETRSSNNASNYFYYSALELALRVKPGRDVYHCLSPVEALYTPKTRTIVTFHDFIPVLYLDKIDTHYLNPAFNGFSRKMARTYFNFACKVAVNARFLVCTNESVACDLISLYDIDPSKVLVIRPGIPDYGPVKSLHSKIRFGTVCFLDKRKRVNLLIEAFKNVRNADYELIIGGAGADMECLKGQAAGDPRISFLGFIPEEQMNGFYNSLDYFIFPTKVEGYGLPMVEAMACKKPVVVMEDSIIPEEIKRRCINVGGIPGLTEFIRKPFYSPDVEEENYKFAKSHNWAESVLEYVKLYNRIC